MPFKSGSVLIAVFITMIVAVGCSSSTWEETRQADTYEAYQAYIDDNPDGEHLNEARNRADSLYWQSVQDDTTAASVESYLEKFPEGRFRTDAFTKLNLLSSNYPTEAVVTGSGVIIRSDHTTGSSSVGVVANAGTKVQVQEQYNSGNSSEAILKRSARVTANGRTITLGQGKALRILADRGDSVRVSFSSTEFGRAEAMISKSDIEAMEGQTWYKITTSEGITGWIYGKFIEINR